MSSPQADTEEPPSDHLEATTLGDEHIVEVCGQ